MARTRATLLAMVKNRTARTDKDDVIIEGLDLGLEEYTMRHEFRALRLESDLSIVADDESVSAPSTMRTIEEARLIDGTMSYPMRIKSKSWLTSRWADVSELSTSKPQYLYEETGTLYLYPVSDGTYTVRVTTYSNCGTLSASTTENPVPLLDSAIVHWATAYLYNATEQYEKAATWERMAERAFQVAVQANGRVVRMEIKAALDVPESLTLPSERYLDPFAGH